MVEIRKAINRKDYETIADLGFIIWTEYYTPIIGSDQVTYMLDKFQSAQAIEAQIKEGYNCFLTLYNKKEVGYLSIVQREKSLFLSKIYVLEARRGLGIGKFAMDFVQQIAKESSLNSISLTVNKHNLNSIKAYEKMGFVKVDELVIEIGNGFIMDDFKMVKPI